jgi:ligand-binding sensor domain-containing protein/signal transduction histidine kinase
MSAILHRVFRTLVLCVVVGAIPSRAETTNLLSDFTQRVWHVQDGLPDQVVQALIQTPDHYLWIGTTKGLLRFDGMSFVPYSGVGAEALRHGVTCLMVARDQSLYIGTEGSGLLRYRNGRMEQFGIESGLTNPIVRALFQDRSGILWVATDRGLFHQHGRGFDHIEALGKYPNVGSAAVLQDHSGAIWSGGSKLLRLSGNTFQEFVLPSQNGSMRIKALHEAADGSIWVGAVAGLFHQLPSGEFVKIPDVHGTVRTFGQMPSGEMWAGTVGDGVFVQHGTSFMHVEAPGVLPSNTILSQTTDMDGNLWIGTQTGLLRLSRSGMRLTPLPHASDSDFGTLMRDTDGALWICSNYLFRMQHGITTRYRFPHLGEVTIRTMLREHTGALWLGTAGQGAYRIEPNGDIAHYTAQIGTNYIRGFMQVRDGSVWIATDGGVSHFHDGYIDDFHEVVLAPHTLTLALAEGLDGRIWIGTLRGLITFHKGAYEEVPASNGFRNQSVWALHVDNTGAIWIGADSGLYRLKNDVLYHFGSKVQGPTTAVYQIMEDAHSFWIGGPTRIVRLNRVDLDRVADGIAVSGIAHEVFPVSNEIQSAELYGGMQPAGVLDGDGSAWFPSSQGPLHLLPGEKPAGGTVPLVIDRVLIDGRPSDSVSSLDLQPGTKTLEIDYAPILLSSQMDLQFRHKLEGFDDWDPPSLSRAAVYTNLPAGHYVFRAQALYGEASGLVPSVSLSVAQRANFYHRPWFWMLCALLVAAAILSIYRLRVHQIRTRFRTIVGERNRLAREMHDTVIQGCTGVSALLEAFASTAPVEAANRHLLDYAREQIRVTIDEARDAVWDLRSHEIEQLDLGVSLRRLLDQHVKHTGLTPTFEREGTPPALDFTVVYALLMSTREALLNAAAHSSGTRIDLKLMCSPLELSLSVSDNGEGFCVEEALARADRHYGLKGMQERIESIGGALQVASSVGSGTRLIFRIPRATLERRTIRRLEV